MPLQYSIISICVIIFSVPLGFYLNALIGSENAFFMGSVIIGTMFAAVGIIFRFINYKVSEAYLNISKVTDGILFKSKFFSKPRLQFSIGEFTCELTYKYGSQYTPSCTYIHARLDSNYKFRVYRDGLVTKDLKKLNLDLPDSQIGDDDFDKFFIVETRNAELTRSIFSENVLLHIREIKKYISEIKLDDGYLVYSLVGIYFQDNRYIHLFESFKGIVQNYSSYGAGKA
ncbi:MAG: hypothetical protein P8012_15630 [Desulfobacterales bacterium]